MAERQQGKRTGSEYGMSPRRQTWMHFSCWEAWVARKLPKNPGELGATSVVRERDSKVQQQMRNVCLELALTMAKPVEESLKM